MLLKFLTAVLFSTICLSPPTTAMEQTAIEIAPSHPSLPTIYSEIFEGIFQDFIQIPEIPFVKRTYEEKQKLHDRLNKEFLPSFIEASRLGYEEALKTLPLDTITILHQYAQMPPLRAFLTELKTHRQTFPNFLRQSLQQQDHLETIPKTATFSYLIGQLAQFKEIYDSHKHAILANAHKTVSQSEVTQKLISFIKETPTSDLATDVRKLLPTLPASEQDNIITTLTEISNLPAKNWESVPVYLAIKFGHLLWDGKFAEDDWQNVLINQAVQYQDILENFLTNVLRIPLAPYIPSIQNFSQTQQKNILINAVIFYHNHLMKVHPEGFAKYEELSQNGNNIINIVNQFALLMNSPLFNPQMAQIAPQIMATLKNPNLSHVPAATETSNEGNEESSDQSSSEGILYLLDQASNLVPNFYQGIYNFLVSFWQNRPWP